MLEPGDRVGDWIVESAIGEGGMGAVFRVHAVLSERVRAALKVVKTGSDRETRARFVREAESLSALSHPAIVRVMGFGEDEARRLQYLVMELATGDTLRARLAEGPLRLGEALVAFAPLAGALEHAHAAGIFHRDVKPANIILAPDGTAKLVDFGIAAAPDWETLTLSGHIGTFAYLPPEVYRGERPDPAAIDVYAFGQCLHEALTGLRPFAVGAGLPPAAMAAAVAARKVEHGPLEVGESFPEALRQEVARATDPDPGRRATMRALREVLEPLRAVIVPDAPLPATRGAAEAMAATPDRTVRVPEPRKPAYSERPRKDWVRRRRLRARRKGERLVIAGAAAALVLLLVVLLLPRRHAAPAPPAPRQDQGAGSDRWTNPQDGLAYAWVPEGRFSMGCTTGDPKCDPAKLPPRDVSVRHGFWMSRTEVTVGAYKRFAAATGREMPRGPAFDPRWEKEDHPIVNVPWSEAGAYCAWAGGRLPSEAEWEWAARGGKSDWFYPWGREEPVCEAGAANGARFEDGGRCHDAGTGKVAAYGENGYGLYDLAGNAWEWCEDLWKETEPEVGDVPGDPRPRRVLRGGSWVNDAFSLRVSIRSRWYEGRSSRDFIGFRCVQDPASTPGGHA